MKEFRPLEPSRHAGWRMKPVPDAAALRYALLGLSEIPVSCADFPLCFAKDGETGRFNLIVLLSLDEPRNLYWREGAWRCTSVPQSALVEGFRLDAAAPLGLAIDEHSPRFGPAGQALFDRDGQGGETVRAIETRLRRLSDDLQAAQAMADLFAELDLLQGLEVVLRWPAGAEHEVSGLYSLSPSALAALPDQEVVKLYRNGYLAAAVLIATSINQMERLSQLRGADQDGSRPDLRLRLVTPNWAR
jgi:hypothetical protein